MQKRAATSSRKAVLICKAVRGYYFSSLKSSQRNTDFPLNIGYNNYFQHYAMYKGTRQEQIKLRLRQKALTLLFRDHYYDLLAAIVSKSYEQLELLCEENLTEAVAASIYEVTEINKQTFGVVKNGNEFSCEILNHFFVENMQLQRKLN